MLGGRSAERDDFEGGLRESGALEEDQADLSAAKPVLLPVRDFAPFPLLVGGALTD